MLIVVGSMNARSREQLDTLQPIGTPILTLAADADLPSMADAIDAQFSSVDVMAITTSTAPADPREVAQRLSHIVAHVIEKAYVAVCISPSKQRVICPGPPREDRNEPFHPDVDER